MGELKPLRAWATGAIAVLAIVVVGCGPTASVVTTATPQPGQTSASVQPTVAGEPSAGPSADPGASQAVPTAGTETAIPVSPPTPFAGSTWRSLGDFPAGDAFEVTAVTPLGTGFVAVGFQQAPGEGFFGRRQGVVWRSDDGVAWQSTVDPVFQFVTPEEIVALGDSLFVFGTIEQCDRSIEDECVEPPDSGWAVWRSAAGGAWERLPQLAEMQVGTVDGVVAASGLLVAYGWTRDEGQAIVWTSTDGVTWASTADLAEMDPVSAMGSAPGGLVAFGTRLASELGDLELVAAVSTDRAHFGRVSAPALPAATVQSVVAGPAGLVAVGDADDDNLNVTGIALHSADGLSWTQTTAADGSFAGSAIASAHALPQGYVAIGVVPQLDDFGIATGASWTSRDGQSWQTLAPFGDRFSQLTSSAAGATRIVAFTVTEEEPDDETVISTISAWFAPIDALTLP